MAEGKSPKSGKSTPSRAQLRMEEAQRQEDERLKIEEQLEQERLAREEKKMVEKNRLEALKLKKSSQRVKSRAELERTVNYLKKTFGEEKYNFEFERFTRSGGRPDPLELRAINTYMSLLDENGTSEMEDVLEDVKLILSILEELHLITDKYTPELTEEIMELRQQTITDLQALSMKRYDMGTLKVLQEATFEADSDTGNLLKVYRGLTETLLIWGNLMRNPRMTGFKFAEEKLEVEIPKTLAVADVGVRILKTTYDHFSTKCSTYFPKKSAIPVLEAPGMSESDVKGSGEGEGEEGVGRGEDEEDGRKSVKIMDPEETDLNDEKPTEQENSNESKVSNEKSKPEDTEQSGEAAEAVEAAVEGGEGEGEAAALPADGDGEADDVKEADEIKLVTEVEEEEILDADVIDLRQFMRLGDIMEMSLVKMPPQPVVVNGWTLTQVLEDPLTTLTYPLEVVLREETSEEKVEKVEKLSSTSLQESEQAAPEEIPIETIDISMEMPKNVMFYEEPQVARWDETDNHWKTSGISDVVYKDVEKRISFKSSNFGRFCLLQDTHLNMPFQSWELQATGDDSAKFTVLAACSENVFEIKGTLCRLMKLPDSSSEEFEHIYDEWMFPEKLIKLMKKAGNNIFPNVDSVHFVSVADKEIDPGPVYDQMAYLCPSFAFTWSKFSNDVRENQLIFQMIPLVEHTPKAPAIVEDIRAATFLVMPDRCYKLGVSEQEERLSFDLATGGAAYQTDLFHAATLTPILEDPKEDILAELAERLEHGNLQLISTVRYLLRATNVLTFS